MDQFDYLTFKRDKFKKKLDKALRVTGESKKQKHLDAIAADKAKSVKRTKFKKEVSWWDTPAYWKFY